VKLLLATFGFGLLSSAVPVANIEAFLAAGTTQNAATWWALAGAATIGQMLGKVGFYLLGRQSLDWAWLRRRTEHGSGAKWWGRLNSMADQRWEVTWLGCCSRRSSVPAVRDRHVLAGSSRVRCSLSSSSARRAGSLGSRR
jgi:hypothetical protein